MMNLKYTRNETIVNGVWRCSLYESKLYGMVFKDGN